MGGFASPASMLMLLKSFIETESKAVIVQDINRPWHDTETSRGDDQELW